MKKLTSNSMVCVGSFNGPDIEEGTFHKSEAVTDISHKNKAVQKCPCHSTESNGIKVPEDSNEDNKENTGNND